MRIAQNKQRILYILPIFTEDSSQQIPMRKFQPPKKADTADIFLTAPINLRISLIQRKRTVTEAIPS